MSRTHSTPPSPLPHYGLDLDYRPASYGDFPDPLAAILNGVNGQNRREMIRDMLAGPHRDDLLRLLGPVDEGILVEQADEAFVRTLSRSAGPEWLGGEYLPRRKQGEVELARIVLASVLSDVIVLRARWSGGRYHYRMVDEYEASFELCRKTSRRPLTLGQVIEILETVEGEVNTEERGIVACWWEQQLQAQHDPADCTAFAWVESELYPDLPAWYAHHAAAWEEAVAARQR